VDTVQTLDGEFVKVSGRVKEQDPIVIPVSSYMLERRNDSRTDLLEKMLKDDAYE
jgi:hypothetical protein